MTVPMMRSPIKFPSIRGMCHMDDMYLIRLFARIASYKYAAMTLQERERWERRLRSVYDELLRRLDRPGEPVHRGRDAATVPDMIG